MEEKKITASSSGNSENAVLADVKKTKFSDVFYVKRLVFGVFITALLWPVLIFGKQFGLIGGNLAALFFVFLALWTSILVAAICAGWVYSLVKSMSVSSDPISS